MQIVIDIPEEYYKNLLNNNRFSSEEIPIVSLAVASGIPLPQNHGDLIDANELKASMFCYMGDMTKSYKARYVMSVAKGLVDFQKPLVKADERDE